MDWLTSVVILVSAFLWYLLHYFAVNSLACERLIDWWLQREAVGWATLQWTSILIMTLALWFCAVIICPKSHRVPLAIRFLQGFLVGIMVLISVLQWGLYRPHSEEGRFHRFFYEDMASWPVLNAVLPQRWWLEIYPPSFSANIEPTPEILKVRHLLSDMAGLQIRKWDDTFIPHRYARSHVVNGQYFCSMNATYSKWSAYLTMMEMKVGWAEHQRQLETIEWPPIPAQTAPSSGGGRPDG